MVKNYPLSKGHLAIKDKIFGPSGVSFRQVTLYNTFSAGACSMIIQHMDEEFYSHVQLMVNIQLAAYVASYLRQALEGEKKESPVSIIHTCP